jgi:signal transduction histidine kinase
MIREIAGKPSNEVQHSVYLFLAHIAEQQPYADSLRRIDELRADSPAMALDLWIVSDSGNVLAANTVAPPPARFARMPMPLRAHEVVTRGRFFSGSPAIASVRLNTAQPTYLLVRNRGTPSRGTFLILAALFVVTVVGAIFSGLLLVTFYLRGRSQQVKQVIARMESGDLGARFVSDRLDAVGGLMLDFNRMADEIQRLVARLETTERARRELLQELGHDLRTPLTSMRTAVETLTVHGSAMPVAEREEFMKVVAGELAYFSKLIDDLFFIAEIDEPRYRKNAERIDLAALLAAELHAAQASPRAGKELRFEFDRRADDEENFDILGDAYLASRLFRNALDNAMRHAHSSICVSIRSSSTGIEIVVEDDGEGMPVDAIAAFGQCRSRRFFGKAGSDATSLGLGSVIIRTIVELHHGQLSLASRASDPAVPGTRMTITFPRER